VEVHSFSPPSLHRFHRSAPAYPLSLLVDRPRPNPRGYRWAQAVEPRVGDFSEGFVDRAHADHLQVYAWDSSSPPQMEQLADWGVNGVTTDRPDVAHTELRSRP
jgi:glycerophosphoryl diester phosphodiesterase